MRENVARKYGQILDKLSDQDRQALSELQLFQREVPLAQGMQEKVQALSTEMRSLGVEAVRGAEPSDLGRMAQPATPGHEGRDVMARFYDPATGPAQDLAAKYGRQAPPAKELERQRGMDKEPGG